MEVMEDWRYFKSNILMYRKLGVFFVCLSTEFDLALPGDILNPA